jgi:hypothetical protein
MKRSLTLCLMGIALLALASGCARNNRGFQGDRPTDEPVAATALPTQGAVQPTLTPVELTATLTPARPPVSTPSDQLSNQLDQALDQLDQQLNSVDALDDTPAAP